MKLDEPVTWREFFRGLAVSVAVGAAAASLVIVPWAVAGLVFDGLRGPLG